MRTPAASCVTRQGHGWCCFTGGGVLTTPHRAVPRRAAPRGQTVAFLNGK